MDDKRRTLLFLLRNDEILLALKKRGFGVGLRNGVGGKIEPGETIEQAMLRECQEEICVTPQNYKKVAKIDFNGKSGNEPWTIQAHIYTSDTWQGEPTETEEMAPKWYKISEIPYEQMWDDDKYWLPLLLTGAKFKSKITLDEHDKVASYHVNKLATL